MRTVHCTPRPVTTRTTPGTRRPLRSAFLPTAIAQLEPRVAAIADKLLDDIVPRGQGDFIGHYAFLFPGDRHR